MKHIMLDLETWGKSKDSVVVSIGAVPFTEEEILLPDHLHFYHRLELDSQIKKGRTITASTIRWWLEQSENARKEFYNSQQLYSTRLALSGFIQFVRDIADWDSDGVEYNKEEVCIWGNGATFDNVILASLCDTYEFDYPVSFRNDRCYRTIKNIYSNIEGPDDEIKETSHVAVEDARWQAKHLIKICKQENIILN